MDHSRPDAVQPATPLPVPGGGGTSRRTVLGLVVVAGAGPLLTACGGGDADTAGTGGDTSSSSPPDAPADSGSESDGGGSGLVASADVPVSGGVVLEGKKIVVTQPEAGQFKAFTAVCTHMQCLVSSVKDNTISCPCHGSTYSAADGSVKGGPASAPLRSIPVTVEGDQIVKA